MQGVMHQWAKIIEFSVYVATPPPNPCNYDKGTCLPICVATTCECLVSRVSESGVVVVIVVIAPPSPSPHQGAPSPWLLFFVRCSLLFVLWSLFFVLCSLFFAV